MKGIEVAFIGRVVRPLTERTSNEGNRWGHILLAVGTKDESELLSVSVFHGVVDVAAELEVGDRAYVEGRIRVRRYKRNGEQQTSLNVAAFTFEPVGRIGRKRPNRSDEDTPDATRTRARVMASDAPTVNGLPASGRSTSPQSASAPPGQSTR